MQSLDMSPTFAKPKRKTLLGLRRSALIEILLSLGLLLLFDAIALDHTRYWAINPHPFWFVVLFIACKYGAKEGIVAAILSSLALLIGNLPEQALGQDSYAYILYVLKLPLLWLISAVAFGELRQMHIRERNQLEDDLLHSEERESRIAQSYQWVKELKDQLELRMAGQLRSSIAAYHAATALESLTPSDVMKGIEELVSATLYPDQFSIYALSGDGLSVALMHGWKEQDSYLRQFGPANPIYQAVVGRQETLCVVNVDQERLLSGQAILAGPLFDRKNGEVIGMLKIEKMGFTDLHLSNIEAFETICQWAGMALINARKYQIAKADSVVNPDHNLLTQGYFKRYSDYMSALAQRVGFDVSMIVIRLTGAERLDEVSRARIARALAETVDSVLRGVDLAFDYQGRDGEYSIVLPATGKQGAQAALEKIRKALEARKSMGDAKFTFSVQTVYEKRAA